jgi:hypothetical protein
MLISGRIPGTARANKVLQARDFPREVSYACQELDMTREKSKSAGDKLAAKSNLAVSSIEFC